MEGVDGSPAKKPHTYSIRPIGETMKIYLVTEHDWDINEPVKAFEDEVEADDFAKAYNDTVVGYGISYAVTPVELVRR